MARGSLPIEAILTFMRPYCDLGPVSKLLLRSLASPFLALVQPRFREGYNLGAAALVKQQTSLPVITLGGMRSKAFMEQAISSGKTDFVSMARPLILEPDLARKFREGTSTAARCDNCNRCVVAVDMAPIYCYNDRLNPNPRARTAMGH